MMWSSRIPTTPWSCAHPVGLKCWSLSYKDWSGPRGNLNSPQVLSSKGWPVPWGKPVIQPSQMTRSGSASHIISSDPFKSYLILVADQGYHICSSWSQTKEYSFTLLGPRPRNTHMLFFVPDKGILITGMLFFPVLDQGYSKSSRSQIRGNI